MITKLTVCLYFALILVACECIGFKYDPLCMPCFVHVVYYFSVFYALMLVMLHYDEHRVLP
jgi:hypothetical protein